MNELEEARRQRDLDRAHIASLEDSHRDLVQRNNQANAKIKYVTDRATKAVKEAVELLDVLHARIDIMVDAWVDDIIDLETDPKRRIQRIARVEAFRPRRIADTPEPTQLAESTANNPNPNELPPVQNS